MVTAMVPQLPRTTFARRWRWLIRMSPALVVATLAMAVAAPAQAAPRYTPDCHRAVCVYENPYWNHHEPVTHEDDNGAVIQFWPGEFTPGFMPLNPDISPPSVSLGGTLVNRVSSYANNLSVTFCVYDRLPGGTGVLLWDMPPDTSSSRVHAKMVGGSTVNNRADHIEQLRGASRCPPRVPDRR